MTRTLAEWDAVPSPYEDQILRKWQPRVRAMARSVWAPHRRRLTLEAVESDLQLAVLQACRRFPAYGEGPPSQAFVATFVRRALVHVWRTPWAREDSLEGEIEGEATTLEIVDDNAVQGDEAVASADMAAAAAGLVYALKRNLPPAAFAVLHLRYVEEVPAEDLASALATDTRRVTARVENARFVAQELLAQLGVRTIEQLRSVALEDFDADELD